MLKALNYYQSFKKPYTTRWVEDLDENREKNTIYIIGGREYPYYAAISCPKRKCKKVIHLEISSDFERRWKFIEHEDGTLSLKPSIYVTKYSCKCHYWIEKGHVIWAEIPPFFIPKDNLNP